ncbi:MAG: hypothetical protein GY804_09675 [Alphaproteobacteria bacterium]|nr:hypothetical protein [Alphaproteobacteria bacterium]
MREIKFRAWDNEKKEMTPPFYLGSELSMMLIDCEVMQYTGSKDKNGKEIYESDKVKHIENRGSELYPDEITIIEEVRYEEGAFYPICEQPSENFEVIGNIWEDKK